jgi:hypothetical protein
MPIYLVTGQDFSKNIVFKRVVYARNKSDIVPMALYEENKERSFQNRLIRSKLYYSIKTLICFVPELDDPRIVVEMDTSAEIKVEQEPDVQ